MDLKAKKIRRKCDVPGCRNTVSYSLSRFRTFGNCVVLCEECINGAVKLVNEILNYYTCDLCGEKFLSQSDLHRHMIEHYAVDTGETVAEVLSVESEDTVDTTDNADIADTSDTTDTSDTAVVYTCDVCGKEFDSEANLKRHIAMAHKEEE